MSIITYNDISKALCQLPIPKNLGLVVTIPCYKEDAIIESVNSLLNCKRPSCHVEIIVLINTPEQTESTVSKLNQSSYIGLKELKQEENVHVIPIHIEKIPVKKAGVGLARKLAMDEAYRRLMLSENQVKIISCFDADCQCEENYLAALHHHFLHSQKEAVSIHYEHLDADLNGTAQQRAIYLYELHLRYFIDMQRQIKLPFAFHTVGSSMACTADGYRRIGGMNKRKAGEDFYFLQKFIQDNQCEILNTSVVYPSARESDRVPFGTGKAISQILSENDIYLSYNSRSFYDLMKMTQTVEDLYDPDNFEEIISSYSNSLNEFLKTISFKETLIRLRGNTKTQATFRKAFYQYFDAFQLMKYLHFVRDSYYPNVNVLYGAKEALQNHHQINVPLSELLKQYRMLDRRIQ